MKKSLILVGMLVVGYANAQEGNVGINTETPKATLEVLPTKKNLEGTTNEGIVAPKLTKARIANIAEANLVEGTLVYATDTTYTGNNAKVAKITEKGYYFYNGTEWVKAGNDVTSQIWQKQADKSILLVDNDVENEVRYNVDGGYINIPNDKRTINFFDNGIIREQPLNINRYNSSRLNIGYSDKIPVLNTGGSFQSKQLVENILFVDEKENSIIKRIYGSNTMINTTKSFTKDLSSLYANVSASEHMGEGKVSLMIGAYNSSSLYNGSSDRVVGAYNQATSRVSSDIPTMEATYNYLTPRGSGSIANAFASRNYARLETGSNIIDNLVLSNNRYDIFSTFTGTVNNLIGVYVMGHIEPSNPIKNMYGLKIESIRNGSELNYAIHTGAGKVRVGNLADASATADRVVTVDADGVLKTGSAANIPAVAIGSTTAMVCNVTNRGKMNFIQGADGKSDVFGICMKNADGKYYWGYMVGGNNPTNGEGAFGSGL